MIGVILAIFALVIGLALWVGVNLGKLQADAVAIAIVALALAILVGPAITYVRGGGGGPKA